MEAIKRAKIYARERVALETVLPLEVPFSVQIDICSACNLKCNFCFHSDTEKIREEKLKFGAMPFDVFKKIIDDMRNDWNGKQVKKLRLFKIGEPLMNPDVCHMVEYAKKQGVAECIEITTNGTLLSEELSMGLIDAGLDILNVSVNGISEEQYERACQIRIDFGQFVDQIRFFHENKGKCNVFVKYSDIGYSEQEKESFYQIFGDACDEIYVENISSTLWQDTNIGQKIRATDKGTYGQELRQKEVCPFLFTTMAINDRGIAHLCCVDWKSEYVLGDLREESIGNVWNGEKLRSYQIAHLKKQKDRIPLCQKCESLSANTTDDIDDYADMILERIAGNDRG